MILSQKLTNKCIRFAGSRAIANRNRTHVVFLDQAMQLPLSTSNVFARFGGENRCLFKKLAGFIDDSNLAAGAETRVDAHDPNQTRPVETRAGWRGWHQTP